MFTKGKSLMEISQSPRRKFRNLFLTSVCWLSKWQTGFHIFFHWWNPHFFRMEFTFFSHDPLPKFVMFLLWDRLRKLIFSPRSFLEICYIFSKFMILFYSFLGNSQIFPRSSEKICDCFLRPIDKIAILKAINEFF